MDRVSWGEKRAEGGERERENHTRNGEEGSVFGIKFNLYLR